MPYSALCISILLKHMALAESMVPKSYLQDVYDSEALF